MNLSDVQDIQWSDPAAGSPNTSSWEDDYSFMDFEEEDHTEDPFSQERIQQVRLEDGYIVMENDDGEECEMDIQDALSFGEIPLPLRMAENQKQRWMRTLTDEEVEYYKETGEYDENWVDEFPGDVGSWEYDLLYDNDPYGSEDDEEARPFTSEADEHLTDGEEDRIHFAAYCTDPQELSYDKEEEFSAPETTDQEESNDCEDDCPFYDSVEEEVNAWIKELPQVILGDREKLDADRQIRKKREEEEARIEKLLKTPDKDLTPEERDEKHAEKTKRQKEKEAKRKETLRSTGPAKDRHALIQWACDLKHLQDTGASEEEIEAMKAKEPKHVYVFPGQRRTMQYGRYYDDPNVRDYFNDLFGCVEKPDRENILIWQGQHFASYYLGNMRLSGFRTRAFRKFYNDDLFFTPNTYKPCGKGKTPSAAGKNVYRINAWAIDIDYKKNPVLKRFAPLDLAYYILECMEGVIPVPNWIEYGHQMRFIYILAEPINCKCEKGLRAGIRHVSDFIIKKLNEEFDCHAERQGSWFRVPGSVNKKDGSVVRVEHVSDVKYTVQELLTEFLPTLPMEKEEYYREKARRRREAKRKEKNHLIAFFSPAALHKRRIEDYMAIIEGWTALGYKVPRELFLHLYITSWFQTVSDSQREFYMEELLRINRMLPVPLRTNEIKGKFKTELTRFEKKKYKYKNTTIMERLNLTPEDCQMLGLHLHVDKKTEEKEQRIAEGRTHRQMTWRRVHTMRPLIAKGYSTKEIAKQTGYTQRMVQYEVRSIADEILMARKNAEKYEEIKRMIDERNCREVIRLLGAQTFGTAEGSMFAPMSAQDADPPPQMAAA